MRTPNYALILVILVLTNVATYWVREKPMRVLFSPRLESLPCKLGRWDGRDLEISAEDRKALNADALLSRGYTNAETGETAGLMIVYRKYGRRDFIHRPELCYPAHGWTIAETGTTTLPYCGHDIEATKVVAEKAGSREVIVYWFASGERTQASFVRQQYVMALDRFSTQRYGWAFIRINCPVVSTDEETMDTIRGLLTTASDPLLASLTGSRLGTGSDR
jgi:EpsI family protein